MKKVIFILAIAITAATANAQTQLNKAKKVAKETEKKAEKKEEVAGPKVKNLTSEERADKITNRLKTELALTEEQVPKVKQATLTRVNKVAEAKKKNGEDKKALGQEKKAAFQSWETEMKGILTTEQYNTYQTKKEEQKKKLQEKKAAQKDNINNTIQETEEELEDIGE